MSRLIFFSIGDWGTPTLRLRLLVNSMNKIAETHRPSFIIALGDNFYEDGVASVYDSKWNTHFENVFMLPFLKCKWFPILGNHDYLGNPDAQIEYYKRNPNGRWFMPHKYYSKIFKVPQSEKTLEILFLDTVTLCPFTSSRFIPINHKVSKPLNPNLYYFCDFLTKSTAQLQWIEKTLAKSTASWILLVGHYPMYTSGYHDNCPELIEKLSPLIIKYKVSAYVNGHDHIMEHINNNNIHCFTNGSASKEGETYKKSNTSLFLSTSSGFLVHSVDNNFLTFQFIDAIGNLLYETKLQPRDQM